MVSGLPADPNVLAKLLLHTLQKNASTEDGHFKIIVGKNALFNEFPLSSADSVGQSRHRPRGSSLPRRGNKAKECGE